MGCCQECLAGLTKRLENKVGKFVGIYEKNGNIAFGTIRSVKNNTVKLVRGDFDVLLKLSNPGCPLEQVARVIFIPICEISEFVVGIKSTPPGGNGFCSAGPLGLTDSPSKNTIKWKNK